MTGSHPDDLTLNDYADGALASHAQADVDAHLAGCGDCRALVESLRQVHRTARQLPPLTPPRDAWARIERSLRPGGTRRTAAGWTWMAAAAALALAVLGGVTAVKFRHQPQDSAPQAASTEDVPSAQWVEAELRDALQHYQKAVTGLERIANDGKGSLDPQLASTLEKNLTVVDQAISESRAALKAQPASAPAQASLLDSFKAKIALLQDTVALINEMREATGGRATGAGRIASGLKKGN